MTIKTVIPGKLFRGCRPGYYSHDRRDVKVSEVDHWIQKAKESGIKTILCLLDKKLALR